MWLISRWKSCSDLMHSYVSFFTYLHVVDNLLEQCADDTTVTFHIYIHFRSIYFYQFLGRYFSIGADDNITYLYQQNYVIRSFISSYSFIILRLFRLMENVTIKFIHYIDFFASRYFIRITTDFPFLLYTMQTTSFSTDHIFIDNTDHWYLASFLAIVMTKRIGGKIVFFSNVYHCIFQSKHSIHIPNGFCNYFIYVNYVVRVFEPLHTLTLTLTQTLTHTLRSQKFLICNIDCQIGKITIQLVLMELISITIGPSISQQNTIRFFWK